MLDSVVIDDFDFMGAVCFPTEADSPWVIDADGVLAFSVALERFEAVGREQVAEIRKVWGSDILKLASRGERVESLYCVFHTMCNTNHPCKR